MSGTQLSVTPRIDPSATVRDSQLGAYTAVGPHTTMAETTMDDYFYVVNDSIIYSEIGKFCSIIRRVEDARGVGRSPY